MLLLLAMIGLALGAAAQEPSMAGSALDRIEKLGGRVDDLEDNRREAAAAAGLAVLCGAFCADAC